jgi:hypothetical protein
LTSRLNNKPPEENLRDFFRAGQRAPVEPPRTLEPNEILYPGMMFDGRRYGLFA